MKTHTIEIAIELVPITCASGTCGLTFAVPQEWDQDRRRSHTTFWCPNGHSQEYIARSAEEKLLAELERERRSRTALLAQLDQERAYAREMERSRRALRGVATRLRNKAKAGQCVFCGQVLPDLTAHVAEQHADVDPDVVDESEGLEKEG